MIRGKSLIQCNLPINKVIKGRYNNNIMKGLQKDNTKLPIDKVTKVMYNKNMNREELEQSIVKDKASGKSFDEWVKGRTKQNSRVKKGLLK